MRLKNYHSKLGAGEAADVVIGMWAIWVGFSLDQNTFLGDYVNIAAGGGYGEPEARNPQSVAEDVNRKWLSEERAKSVYKVALLKAANGIDFTVDEVGTRRLRDS